VSIRRFDDLVEHVKEQIVVDENAAGKTFFLSSVSSCSHKKKERFPNVSIRDFVGENRDVSPKSTALF